MSDVHVAIAVGELVPRRSVVNGYPTHLLVTDFRPDFSEAVAADGVGRGPGARWSVRKRRGMVRGALRHPAPVPRAEISDADHTGTS